MRVTVFSVYQGNIPPEVVSGQHEVVRRFLPAECDFHQYLSGHHAIGINEFLARHYHDVYVLLDIDCIPLDRQVLPWMIDTARSGALVGCAQRANHLNNGGHIYAGPCGLAFSLDLYDLIGRPSFCANDRGDVGEELTYRCEERGLPVRLLWPTHVAVRKWDLRGGLYFGHGTTYGGALFHAFEIGKHLREGLSAAGRASRPASRPPPRPPARAAPRSARRRPARRARRSHPRPGRRRGSTGGTAGVPRRRPHSCGRRDVHEAGRQAVPGDGGDPRQGIHFQRDDPVPVSPAGP